MPDKAFVTTEKDFIMPINEAAGVLQFEIILFSPHSPQRNLETQSYINAHYEEISEHKVLRIISLKKVFLK